MSSQLDLQDLAILLVEPSSTQRKIIIGHLKDVGIDNVLGVGSGQEALENMEGFYPDLVISSMYFDDMTGTDLVHAMRNDDQMARTAFMLISSEEHYESLEPIRQAGVIAILPKPFRIDDLSRALHATLDYIEPNRIELQEHDIASLRVLVVDDSRMARNHISRVLEQLGIGNITQAENGAMAVEIMRGNTFDLVVTDYNMPEMDGRALVKYIRNESEQPEIPVLMVTSENDQASLASVRQAGVSALCDKPFDIHTVRQLVTMVFSK